MHSNQITNDVGIIQTKMGDNFRGWRKKKQQKNCKQLPGELRKTRMRACEQNNILLYVTKRSDSIETSAILYSNNAGNRVFIGATTPCNWYFGKKLVCFVLLLIFALASHFLSFSYISKTANGILLWKLRIRYEVRRQKSGNVPATNRKKTNQFQFYLKPCQDHFIFIRAHC